MFSSFLIFFLWNMNWLNLTETPGEKFLLSFQVALIFHLFSDYQEQIRHLSKLTYKFSDIQILKSYSFTFIILFLHLTLGLTLKRCLFTLGVVGCQSRDLGLKASRAFSFSPWTRCIIQAAATSWMVLPFITERAFKKGEWVQ